MEKTIALPESIYNRLANHAKPFEMPADVISRLLDLVESRHDKPIDKAEAADATVPSSPPPRMASGAIPLPVRLPINFYPESTRAFKNALLKTRSAWVLLHKTDGTRELHHWKAYRFSESSDVLGNLRSGYLRGWREKGIVRADVAINKHDLDKIA